MGSVQSHDVLGAEAEKNLSSIFLSHTLSFLFSSLFFHHFSSIFPTLILSSFLFLFPPLTTLRLYLPPVYWVLLVLIVTSTFYKVGVLFSVPQIVTL